MFYHPTKQAAIEAAAGLLDDPRVASVRFDMEERNGWVIVVVPKLHDLTAWQTHCEVWQPVLEGRRITGRPASYIRPPTAAQGSLQPRKAEKRVVAPPPPPPPP